MTIESDQYESVVVAGKHEVKKDRKGLSKEIREKKDAKSAAMSIKVCICLAIL